ncbi:hypothetical protein DERP_000244 [Dermatophagoides pteronyssinus]|uniref:Galectin n=1 Tax=Dermatophagoides pteronyssinus TaxID=6956 RepID=A0ABQ8IZN3_DERPT|nr:hypothetical protein DERP_000244 [Dermatophagoides pteronyssinus]
MINLHEIGFQFLFNNSDYTVVVGNNFSTREQQKQNGKNTWGVEKYEISSITQFFKLKYIVSGMQKQKRIPNDEECSFEDN